MVVVGVDEMCMIEITKSNGLIYSNVTVQRKLFPKCSLLKVRSARKQIHSERSTFTAVYPQHSNKLKILLLKLFALGILISTFLIIHLICMVNA